MTTDDKCWVGLDANNIIQSISLLGGAHARAFVSDGGLTPHLIDYSLAVEHFESREPLTIKNGLPQKIGGKYRKAFVVDEYPCPDCGQYAILGYYLIDEEGCHQHTRYVCQFWRSGLSTDGTYAPLYKPCGWNGWTVPDPYNDDEWNR